MKHIHLGHSKSVPRHLVHHLQHAGVPHHLLKHGGMMYSGRTALPHTLGRGFAGVQKKDVGSMKPISGEGHRHHKKLVPLRFKL